MLVVINLPLVGIWVSLLKIPYRLLFPAIILFCCIGAYASTNSVFSVWLMLFWGALGYFFNKVGVHPAPMVLGFVLGPILEENFRRAMLLSGGDPMIFVQRPISATLLVVSAVLLMILIFPAIRAKREQALQE